MDNLGQRTWVAIAECLGYLPCRDVGDEAVWSLWWWGMAELGLSLENYHDGLLLFD